MLLNKISALFNPNQYHGWGKKRRYFEGWYYKIISKDELNAFAIIPGIAMDEDGNKHAFIQILDGKECTAEYIKYETSEFKADERNFKVKIAKNQFAIDTITLDLPQINGKLEFSNISPWPSSTISPGIMGPYSFVPFMECYHGIVSMNHTIKGHLLYKEKSINFDGGRGYTEKDWGQSFPSAYVWMQSNHFGDKIVSLKASVAKIPWLTGAFVGFIAGVLLKDKLIQFTSYNGSRLKKSFIDSEKVELILENKWYRLMIIAIRDKSTELASPISGFMDGRIEESMTSVLNVQLLEKKSNTMISDSGRNAGLEVAGKIKEIII